MRNREKVRGDRGHGRERKQVRVYYTETLLLWSYVTLCVHSSSRPACISLHFAAFTKKLNVSSVNHLISIIFLRHFQWHEVFDFILVFMDIRNNGAPTAREFRLFFFFLRLLKDSTAVSLSKPVSGLDVICFLLFKSMHIHQEGSSSSSSASAYQHGHSHNHHNNTTHHRILGSVVPEALSHHGCCRFT